MDSGRSKTMLLIVTKNTTQDIQPQFVRCCPTMDLIAIVTRDERVEVFRLSGQRAFAVQRKAKDVRIESICWKYNGQYLAVSWSDGVVDVVSTETGNSLQNFRHVTEFNSSTQTGQDGRDKAVMCLGWGMSLLDGIAGQSRVQSGDTQPNSKRSLNTPITLDDFLERDPDLDALGMPTDLPDQLAGFDATELMPKLPTLSVLPATAYKSGQPSLAELFASQPLLDAALHKGPSKELNALNTFLLSDSKGTIRVVVYDSLSIGNISLPGMSPVYSLQHLKHYSHPFAHCHVLLSRIQKAPGEHCIAVIPISLRFLKNAGRNIHFIDFKTAQLETLVQYIGESILAVQYHWKHSQDLPSRFQANIEEDLTDKGEPNLCQSLYQLAATGHCSEKMGEWLKDELAERGHKRWDQAVSQGYVKVIELIQENLLPALDRCSAVLTNLQGLAQYYEHSPAFDVPISSFSTMQDIIRCIRLVGHHMLLFASEEQRRFATFSRWLRHQIDVQASDPTSAAGQELLERDAGVDFTLVFSYIENTLEKSKLEAFLCHPMDAPDIDANPEMYDALRKALKGFTTNKSFKADLLKLPAYHKEWCKHNQMLVGQITTWQRANALVPGALMLDNAEIEFCDVRMVADNDTVAHSLSTFVATVGKTNNSQLSLFRVRHSDIFDDVPKSVKSCEAITIGIPEGRIQNLHFLDDCHILVLVEFKKSARLLSIPISPATGASSGLKFAPVSCTAAEMKWPNGRVADIKSHLNLSSDAIETFTKHKFSLDGSFLPKHFEVNGRKDRRLCVMIGQDLRQFGVFDLDSSENGGRRNSIGAGTEVMTES